MSKHFGCGDVAAPAPPKAGAFDVGTGVNVPFRW